MAEYLLKRLKRGLPAGHHASPRHGACWPDERLCLYRITVARLLIWAMRRSA
ncbi:MAG: hypothetical protein ACTHOJ_03680 [Sphingomonas oligoaromativorans]|jgi:hypothetical protein|uniref:hypothetical protein n=1 Tax=Sphingomonas oligoaromativorans TaxID=575322 RepID=UPI001421FF30|nr:hypothetical protein [Sphingomonas oligoaromativorans]NIJ34209.1 hypothetical protein [Sphingomonas oligoaromativorans]